MQIKRSVPKFCQDTCFVAGRQIGALSERAHVRWLCRLMPRAGGAIFMTTGFAQIALGVFRGCR